MTVNSHKNRERGFGVTPLKMFGLFLEQILGRLREYETMKIKF